MKRNSIMARKLHFCILPLMLALLVFSLACMCLPLSELPFALESNDPVGQESDEQDASGYNQPNQPESSGPAITLPQSGSCAAWLADLEDQFLYPPATDAYATAYDEEILLVTYQISASQIINPTDENVPSELQSYQDDRANHEALWQYFVSLFPQDTWRHLETFSVMTDGEDKVLATVERSWDDPDKWDLSVDIIDSANLNELTSTLIHEYGHLLTLNATQMDAAASEQSCSTYYASDGCSLPSSYLIDFFNRFWPGIYAECLDIQDILDDDDYNDALDDFYWEHRDQFVTDYAATNPDEDIAESWTLFIIAPAPTGHSIADQKILFFYDYPELVNLRETIISSLCAHAP